MNHTTAITSAQRALVEANLSAVHWAIRGGIDVNENVCGMGYEDLYQEGCLALCRAAATYDGQRAKFRTYAETVIRNHLLDYCRALQAKRRSAPVISLDEQREDEGSRERLASCDDTGRQVDRLCLAQLLEHGRRTYSGVARLGIEAMELKIEGYSGSDIANLYGVAPKHVGAWISRAIAKLKKDAGLVEKRAASP